VPPEKIGPETDASAAADELELLRLRNEVRQLREGAKELEKLRAEQAALKLENSRLRAAQAGGQSPSTNAPGLVERADWRFADYSRPEATVQSQLYSMASGDFDGFIGALAPADRDPFMKEREMTKEKFALKAAQGSEKMAGYRILGSGVVENSLARHPVNQPPIHIEELAPAIVILPIKQARDRRFWRVGRSESVPDSVDMMIFQLG
jgi:hypothetical protein